MKKLITLITLISLISLISPMPSFAATDSAILNAVKDKVAAEIADIKLAVAKKAYVGNVTAKSEIGFSLGTRTVVVTPEATIKNGSTELTLKDIKVGDFVIAMGDVDSAGNLTGKRILIVTKSPEDKRKAMVFTVSKTGTNSLIVENLKKEAWTVKISSDTGYTAKTKLVNIESGDKIVVIGSLASTPSTFNALKIHKLTK